MRPCRRPFAEDLHAIMKVSTRPKVSYSRRPSCLTSVEVWSELTICCAHAFAAHRSETFKISRRVSAHSCRLDQSGRPTLQPLVRFLMSQLPPCSRPGMVRAASLAALSNWGVPFSRPPKRAPTGWGRLAASHHASGVTAHRRCMLLEAALITSCNGTVRYCSQQLMTLRLDGCLP